MRIPPGRSGRPTHSAATVAAGLFVLAVVGLYAAHFGRLPDNERMTVGDLLGSWMKVSATKTGTRTHEERERIVAKHLIPRLGSIRLHRLAAAHVETMYADMHRDKIGPFAIRSAADVLNIALNHAVRLRMIPANPAAAIPKPKLPKRDMLFIDDAQANAMLGAGDGAAVGPLVTVALASGCRQGELLALQWEDIDLRAGTLTVRRSLAQLKDGNFQAKTPKTDASRRVIVLPAFAVASLTALKADAMKDDKLAAPVFSTRTGGYLCKRNVLRAFRSLVKKTNKLNADKDGWKPIPVKLRFHDIRHSAASLLLSKGCSLPAVSQRLGHANPTMTLRVYGHVMPGDDAKLAEVLNSVIG